MTKTPREVIADIRLPVDGAYANRVGGVQLNDRDAAVIEAALEAAGFAIVRKEPTKEIAKIGDHIFWEWQESDEYRSPATKIYRAMIAAASQNTKPSP